MTYAFSIMMSWKIITMIYILMSWNSRRKMKILAHDKKFATMLLGKGDAFPFYINRMSYLYMDTPSKMFHALVSSELLRIVRTTTDLINMATRVNLLFIRMEK